MNINTGGPAFPSHGSMGEVANQGMTLRQYAAIKLRVPESGLDWLDAMIERANRDYFAGQALAGCLAGSNRGGDNIPLVPYDKAAEDCYAYAYAMLTAREAKQ